MSEAAILVPIREFIPVFEAICPAHGEFKITPDDHLKGVGCRKCFDDRARNSQENIIARFRQAHGDRN